MSRELTREEKAAIRSLVVKWCANYDRECGCLPLDCECYMLGKCWTGAYCRYFREAVLPLDPALEAALLTPAAISSRPAVTSRNFTMIQRTFPPNTGFSPTRNFLSGNRWRLTRRLLTVPLWKAIGNFPIRSVRNDRRHFETLCPEVAAGKEAV